MTVIAKGRGELRGLKTGKKAARAEQAEEPEESAPESRFSDGEHAALASTKVLLHSPAGKAITRPVETSKLWPGPAAAAASTQRPQRVAQLAERSAEELQQSLRDVCGCVQRRVSALDEKWKALPPEQQVPTLRTLLEHERLSAAEHAKVEKLLKLQARLDQIERRRSALLQQGRAVLSRHEHEALLEWSQRLLERRYDLRVDLYKEHEAEIDPEGAEELGMSFAEALMLEEDLSVALELTAQLCEAAERFEQEEAEDEREDDARDDERQDLKRLEQRALTQRRVMDKLNRARSERARGSPLPPDPPVRATRR